MVVTHFLERNISSPHHRIDGVGFAIKNELVREIVELPVGINERLVTLRLRLKKNRRSAYAPTLDAEEDIKGNFYSKLDQVLTAFPGVDKLVLLGDFNGTVGRDSRLWNNIIGKEGVGKTDSNGILILSKCAEHNLVISNTLYRENKHVRHGCTH